MSLEMKYQGDGGFRPEEARQTLPSLLLRPRGAEHPGSPLLTLTPIRPTMCPSGSHGWYRWLPVGYSFPNHHPNHPFPVPWGIFKSHLLFILFFFFFNNPVGFSEFKKDIHKVVK